jgi:hypothetical protein
LDAACDVDPGLPHDLVGAHIRIDAQSLNPNDLKFRRIRNNANFVLTYELQIDCGRRQLLHFRNYVGLRVTNNNFVVRRTILPPTTAQRHGRTMKIASLINIDGNFFILVSF